MGLLPHNLTQRITSTEFAISLSLFVGVLMLSVKWWIYLETGSVVLFSDAAESVVHILAVWFAWYALRVSKLPPDEDHHFGHDKIAFVSAGVEGALITIAAVIIIGTAVSNLVFGSSLQNLSMGLIATSLTAGVNLLLGTYLVRVGRKEKQILVEANGKHVLTDSWTSGGAVVGLSLAWITGQHWLDPIIAIFLGANIVREGVVLISSSMNGLMDRTNPKLESLAKELLSQFCISNSCSYHRLRLRQSSNCVYIDFHITFPDSTSLKSAHSIASEAEEHVKKGIGFTADVISHLEPDTLPPDHV